MITLIEQDVGSVMSISGSKFPGMTYPSQPLTSEDIEIVKAVVTSVIGHNFTVYLPSSTWSLARGFSSYSRVVQTLEDVDQPDDVSFNWKDRVKNENFHKRKSRGEIVVAPYSVGKITYVFKRSTFQDNGDRSRFSQSAGFYRPAIGWESDDRVNMPISVPFINPDNGGPSVYYLIGFYRQEQWVNEHPLNLQFQTPFKSFSDFNIPFHEECISDATEQSLSGTFDALTELAELPETIRMFIDILKDAAEATRRCRDREVEIRRLATRKGWTAIKLAKSLSDLWLQYRYGISPIAYSLQDLGKTLLEYKRIYAKFRSAAEGVVLPPPIPGWSSSTALRYKVRVMTKNRYTAEGLIDSLLEVLKVNPLATAWELVPLSFVIDWFLNIGQVITNYTSVDMSIDSKTTYSVRISGTCVFTHLQSNARVECTVDVYDRRIISNPRSYTGILKSIDLSVKQKVDGIALLWGPIDRMLKDLYYRKK